MPRVLFVVSGSDHWTLTDGVHQSGYWADELADPHRIFAEAGWDVVIATPEGRRPTPDAGSLGIGILRTEERVREVADYLDSIRDALEAPVPLNTVNIADFDAVFYPGGYGPMEDLSSDEHSARLLLDGLEQGIPLGLVCHGPAALIPCVDEQGEWALRGYRMTGFTDEEERDDVLAARAHWLLQSRLEELGADFVTAPMFTPHIISDRTLHTGQNPQSAVPLAHRILEQATKS